MGKKGYSNNKKKKGKNVARPAATASAAKSTLTPAQQQKKTLRNMPKLSTFHGKSDDSSSHRGIYEIYKEKTMAFCQWMRETLPNSRVQTVNDLGRGADEILKRNLDVINSPDPSKEEISTLVIPVKSVLTDLSTTIELREKLSESVYQDSNDDGHKHMIRVLKHCRSIIGFARELAKTICRKHKNDIVTESAENKADDDAIGGRFNALIIEDDDDDELNEDDQAALQKNIEESSFPKFEPSESSEDMDIEKVLIQGGDMFQSIALLHTMDDLMSSVDKHFGYLKNVLQEQDFHSGERKSVMTLLIECTVAANMATESVMAAEASLVCNYPHLSSFYHVVARVFLADFILKVNQEVEKSKSEAHPYMVLNFVADLVECAFHNKGRERVPAKVKAFCKRSGVAHASAERMAMDIFNVVSVEVQRDIEWNRNPRRLFMESSGMRPHLWLMPTRYIGGDRSILNTLNLVQKLMDVARDDTKLMSMPGYFGPAFDERTSPAKAIRGGLDEPFAASILPELIESCKMLPYENLPETAQLLTVIDLLRKHMNSGRSNPVPIALAFGFHTILTSIFVLQGEGHLELLADCAKQSFNKLFSQIDTLYDSAVEKKNNTPLFEQNLSRWKNVALFAKPLPVDETSVMAQGAQGNITSAVTTERLAFWNPVIGGSFLLYGSYMCSIGLGSVTVDTLGQLRFTQHLYNALKKRENGKFEVPFLESLDKVFTNTKAVWVSGRPSQGSFCKSFWISWGMSIDEASTMQGGLFKTGEDVVASSKKRRQTPGRKLDEITPEEFSLSYKRLVQRDFSKNEETIEYTIRNRNKETNVRYEGLIDLLMRLNTTRDAIDEDGDSVLPVNFTAIGCILLDFINGLSEHMGWEKYITAMMNSIPGSKDKRVGVTRAGNRMKGFTASDLNWRHHALSHLWGSLLSNLDEKHPVDFAEFLLFDVHKIEAYMISFFQNLDPNKYLFFVENKAQLRSATRRNPLLGAYPYGRTGKTRMDPLQGFAHFKYGKRGEPVVRFIKPGKYTPYTPEGNDVSTPYAEPGSKLKRGASGKFRHVASYSLDELIDLNWDGAMYACTKGRHAASGHYVPFIPGYDSDEADEYEPIDINAGKRAGTIGLPADEVGRYMAIPDIQNPGNQALVRIKNAK